MVLTPIEKMKKNVPINYQLKNVWLTTPKGMGSQYEQWNTNGYKLWRATWQYQNVNSIHFFIQQLYFQGFILKTVSLMCKIVYL